MVDHSSSCFTLEKPLAFPQSGQCLVRLAELASVRADKVTEIGSWRMTFPLRAVSI
jgi:hypothetical protein